MKDHSKTNCIVCQASRRSVVDSFLIGYLAGFKEGVRDGSGHAIYPPTELCLPHAKLVTEAHAELLKALFKP